MDQRIEQFEREICERDGGKSQVNRGQAREIRKVVSDLLAEGGMDLVRKLIDDSNQRKANKMNKQQTENKSAHTHVDDQRIADLNAKNQPVNTVDRNVPPEIASSTTEPIPEEGKEARDAAAGQFQQPPPVNEELAHKNDGIREDIPADNVEAGTPGHTAAMKAQEAKSEDEASDSNKEGTKAHASAGKAAAAPAANAKTAQTATKGHAPKQTAQASKNAAAKPLAGKGKGKH